MAQISLKRVIGRKKEAFPIINNLINSMDGAIGIQDEAGRLLLGVKDKTDKTDETLNTKYPVELEGEVIGWVVGGEQAAAVAPLLSHLAYKEFEKKTLARETLDQYREINLLYNLSEKLTASLDLKSVVKLALDEAGRLITGSSGAVMLLNKQKEILETILAFGRVDCGHQDNGDHLRNISLDQGIIGNIIRTGKGEIVNEIASDSRFVEGNHKLSSLVCAPLKTTQKVIGVIFIGSEEAVTYTAADLKLLTTLASQAAPAIEHALLYKDKLKETQQLEEKNLALEQLDKLKDEFLANTSHELRTPLNGIIGIAESMLDGATGPLTPEQNHNLAMITSSGRRLSNLINDILDFSRLKSYELELQIRAVDMRQIVEIVLAFSQSLLIDKPLILENKIGLDIPAVAGDENRLQQIMYNLVGNAIKFTPEGTITVSALERNGMIEFSVSDTGIGIPADKLDDIFKSFEQVDASAVRQYGGTGLGLSLTKQMVELHGGTIWVESQLGQGSRFTFTIPVSPKGLSGATDLNQKIAKMRDHVEPQRVEATSVSTPNGEFTILIVDDEAVNRQVLINHLSLQNYTVIQAIDGLETLELIQQGLKPNLILLDVMMPKMSGYEACQKLRQQYSAYELPIVMLTAKNQVTDLVEGFRVGANDYLPKPFSKKELMARIQTHLHLAQVNTAYERFVPQQFLQFLGKESIVDIKLGDQIEKEMTILFSDVRSFTTLSEHMSPKENFDFINTLLNSIGPVVREFNGFIDKYIGDAIMALFPEQANDAVRASIAMRQALIRYNAQRKEKGQTAIQLGFGIHTGNLILGTVGEAERMESTVISDAVNLAARLEGLTKMYGVTAVISGPTLFSLDQPNQYHFRFLDKVQVKGKKEPVEVFEIFNGDAEEIVDMKLRTRTDFEKGLMHYYSQEFAQAMTHFEKVLKLNPKDVATHLYLKRAVHFVDSGVPADWEGVAVLTEK